MENKKGSEVFLGVIGVATLVVAIIGATFAYFSADARSGNEAINVASTELSIAYDDNTDGLRTDLIPSEEEYALYAGTNPEWIAKTQLKDADGELMVDEDDEPIMGKGECIDDNGNAICSTYTFTIANPNLTTTLDVTGQVFTTLNEFANLKFAIYDEAKNQVQEPIAFDKTGKAPVDLDIETTLLASSKNLGEDGKPTDGFDAEDIKTFTHVTENFATAIKGNATAAFNNVRTYKMVIWIEETGSDQTEEDSGKVFAGGVTFSTLGGKGVTGMIAVAKQS